MKAMFGLPFTPPAFIVRSFANVTIPAYKDSQISSKFIEGATKLRPIIFSHGLSGDKNFYTSVCLALAAHGYLVIAINHQDKSCFHTYDKDGNDLYYEPHPIGSAALRQA